MFVTCHRHVELLQSTQRVTHCGDICQRSTSIPVVKERQILGGNTLKISLSKNQFVIQLKNYSSSIDYTSYHERQQISKDED
jgi:hypothetical protein